MILELGVLIPKLQVTLNYSADNFSKLLAKITSYKILIDGPAYYHRRDKLASKNTPARYLFCHTPSAGTKRQRTEECHSTRSKREAPPEGPKVPELNWKSVVMIDNKLIRTVKNNAGLFRCTVSDNLKTGIFLSRCKL